MNINVKNHKHIVFGSDHYNPLGICRSLGEEGINVYYVLIGQTSQLIKHCRYVKHLYKVDTIEQGVDFIVKTFGKEELKPFIYTGSDDTTQALDNRFDELRDRFYFFNAGAKGRVSHFMDKVNICNLSERYGIPQPKGVVAKKGEMPQGLKYPVLTKVTMSTKGAWKHDVFVCQDEEELKEAYKHIQADELLIQEFIEKQNELCLDGFSFNEGRDVCIPYYTNYLRFSKMAYGGYMIIRPFTDQKVLEHVKNMLREVGFTGIFSVEYLIDKNDNLHFLEVNFRNSTWSYAFTFGGYNLPYLWAKGTLEGKLDLSAIKPQEQIIACSEVDDYWMQVHDNRVPFKKWFNDVRHSDMFFVWNKKDRRPGILYWLFMLKMYLGRKYITHTL